jgi:hypothetical protein
MEALQREKRNCNMSEKADQLTMSHRPIIARGSVKICKKLYNKNLICIRGFLIYYKK